MKYLIVTIVSVIITVVNLVFIGNLNISFKPFRITFDWLPMIAALFLMLGVALLMYVGYDKGKKDGYKNGQEDAYTEVVNEILKQKVEYKNK
jgi:hypothetical protein